jgi:hypothetical protein
MDVRLASSGRYNGIQSGPDRVRKFDGMGEQLRITVGLKPGAARQQTLPRSTSFRMFDEQLVHRQRKIYLPLCLDTFRPNLLGAIEGYQRVAPTEGRWLGSRPIETVTENILGLRSLVTAAHPGGAHFRRR